MSSIIKSLSTPQGLPWRKRRFEECEDESNEPKTKIAKIYYVLESESSHDSDDDMEHDTESVYSIQDKETDVVRDTTDTDTDWVSGEEDEANDRYEIEFSVGSLSDDGQNPFITDEESSPDDLGGAGLVLADLCATAVDADTSTCDELAMWADDTDVDHPIGGEDVWGDNEDIICRRVALTCMMCKEPKPDPMLPYCEKCYQLRKSFFPPRPRRMRSRTNGVPTTIIPKTNSTSTVTTATLSQDSGVGGSQEPTSDSSKNLQFDIGLALNQIGASSTNNSNTPKLNIDLGLDKIIIPSRSDDKEASSATLSTINLELDKIIVPPELMDSGDSAVKNSVQVSKGRLPWSDSDKKSVVGKNVTFPLKGAQSPDDMCIVCTMRPKNGVIVHGSIAHICCCYECARKVWAQTKRCAGCNCKVKNVYKGHYL